MDPHNEMLLWYAAYRGSLTEADADHQPHARRVGYRARMRYRLSHICGHAALRVAVWLLGDEARTTVWCGPDLNTPPVSVRH